MRPLLVGALALVACGGTSPCKGGTAFLTLHYDATSAPATSLTVQMTVAGKVSTKDVTRVAGATTDTLEIDFPDGYQAGASFAVEVDAYVGMTPVGAGDAMTTLPAGCLALRVDVVAATFDDDGGVDGGMPDLAAPDLAMPADLATPDLATPDLTLPPDLAPPPPFGFDRAATYATGAKPRGVRIADLDGDGHADVVTANTASGDVSVLLGKGGGALAPHVDYAATAGAVQVAVGDVDGDHVPDLVVGGMSSLVLLRGSAAMPGHFGAPTTLPAGGQGAVALADLGHGKLDVLAATPSAGNYGGVAEYQNQGGGSFAAPVAVASDSQASDIVPADLDGDGKMDFVYVAQGAQRAFVVFGTGAETFGPSSASLGGGSYPYAGAVGDLNHDGLLDVVVAGYANPALLVYLQKSKGSFGGGNVDPAPSVATENQAFWPAVADLDRDGKNDLVVTLVNGDTHVAFYPGNGDGTFGAAKLFDTTVNPSGLAVGDLDGDGAPDLVVTDELHGGLRVLLNNL